MQIWCYKPLRKRRIPRYYCNHIMPPSYNQYLVNCTRNETGDPLLAVEDLREGSTEAGGGLDRGERYLAYRVTVGEAKDTLHLIVGDALLDSTHELVEVWT